MLKQLIDYFIHTALTHKAVKYARYQKRIYTNAQNSNAYLQFNIDTDFYMQLLISVPNRPLTLTLNIDILAQPNSEYTALEAQDDCLTVGFEWLHRIMDDDTFLGQLQLHDYSFLGLEEYTDDNSAGVRMTVEVIVPDPTNLCDFNDNFSEDNIPDEEVDEIDLKDVNPPTKSDELILRPILLKQKQ